MNIALDYDGTFTRDPELWLAFIGAAQGRGHCVWLVTMRYPSECDGSRGGPLHPGLASRHVPVVCTSRRAKQPFCERLGIKVDVWVDDSPAAVVVDASVLWGEDWPEGKTSGESRMTLPDVLSLLRNPHGRSEDEQRRARLEAADRLEAAVGGVWR